MHWGDTITANQRTPFVPEQTKDVLIVGAQSAVAMLQRLALDDIRAGKGVAYFGNTKKLLEHIPRSRIRDTILFALDRERPRIFNPFAHKEVRDYIDDVFGIDDSTPQLATYLHLLAHVMRAVQGTFQEARYLFTSKPYRDRIRDQLDLPLRKDLDDLYEELSDKDKRNAVQSAFNRLFKLSLDPLYRNILSNRRTLQLTHKTILLVDLPADSKGKLLAALLMACLKGRVYVQYPLVFAGGGQAIVACAHLGELPAKLQADLIGTATLCSFRLGSKDARTLENEFDLPEQDKNLTKLPTDTVVVKLDQTYQLAVPEPWPFKGDRKVGRKIINRSRTWPISGKREHAEQREISTIETM